MLYLCIKLLAMRKTLEKFRTKPIHTSIAGGGVFSYTYFAEVTIDYLSHTFSIRYFKGSVNNPTLELSNWSNKELGVFNELNEDVGNIVQTCFNDDKSS